MIISNAETYKLQDYNIYISQYILIISLAKKFIAVLFSVYFLSSGVKVNCGQSHEKILPVPLIDPFQYSIPVFFTFIYC